MTELAPDVADVRRWRLLVAYDGSGFHGFAPQDGIETVGGALAGAIARAARLGASPPLVCAGRTDAGVHAQGQVVHVDLPGTYSGDLAHAVNRQLAPAVVVRSAQLATAGFDARRSARARRYRYLVWNADVPDPLRAPVAWHVAAPLDLRVMNAATDPLIGEHDFRAFCRRPPGSGPAEPIVRRVIDARWSDEGPGETGVGGRLLRFDVAAQSFCHQMVRSLVGALVEAGRGAGNAATVMSLLASGSRSGAPQPAPAHGLCLMSVDYG